MLPMQQGGGPGSLEQFTLMLAPGRRVGIPPHLSNHRTGIGRSRFRCGFPSLTVCCAQYRRGDFTGRLEIGGVLCAGLINVHLCTRTACTLCSPMTRPWCFSKDAAPRIRTRRELAAFAVKGRPRSGHTEQPWCRNAREKGLREEETGT